MGNFSIELSKSDNTQILLTTHSPSIVKLLEFDHIKLIKSEGDTKAIVNVQRGELPYPSLNEINYLAFGESDDEYHNELYGFIESEDSLNDYRNEKERMPYNKINRDGNISEIQVILSEYIRHQIHHPENTNNARFTNDQLQQSIGEMRAFIEQQI